MKKVLIVYGGIIGMALLCTPAIMGIIGEEMIVKRCIIGMIIGIIILSSIIAGLATREE